MVFHPRNYLLMLLVLGCAWPACGQALPGDYPVAAAARAAAGPVGLPFAGGPFAGGPACSGAACGDGVCQAAATLPSYPAGFDPWVRQVHGQADPMGPARMQQPTPVGEFGYKPGGFEVAYNNHPEDTAGPRLDTSYGLFRSLDSGVFTSEDETTFVAGATILPLQTPVHLLGLRTLVGYTDNQTNYSNQLSIHVDAFYGTRYKGSYFKAGYFIDTQDDFGKTGFAISGLTNLPLLRDATADVAVGFGLGRDQFRDPRSPVLGRQTRIESSHTDVQVRLGKFISNDVQLGVSSNFSQFDFTKDEWGWGAFSNLHFGCTTVGLDLTGGNAGLRGFATVSLNWGACPQSKPQDWRHEGVDTVGWVSTPTMRDLSMRLRSSFTGPLPR